MTRQALVEAADRLLDAEDVLAEQSVADETGEVIDIQRERVRRARQATRAVVDEPDDIDSLALSQALRAYLDATEERYDDRPAVRPTVPDLQVRRARRAVVRELRAYGRLAAAQHAAGRQASSLVRRLLIASDGSRPSDWAIGFGGTLALSLGARVLIVHVVNPAATPVVDPELLLASQEYERRMREEGVAILEAAQRALPASVDSDRMLREGVPALEIAAAARVWNADLVIMGSRGRGRFAQFVLGSTTEAVIREAPCPVVAVSREPAHAPANAARAEMCGQASAIG